VPSGSDPPFWQLPKRHFGRPEKVISQRLPANPPKCAEIHRFQRMKRAGINSAIAKSEYETTSRQVGFDY
jgi:hypothetical protein